ncbi:MAG: prepilin-type N-terminal cleavage/methylation domain-containing protein [bacterium]
MKKILLGEKGFTLIELLVATVIGVLVLFYASNLLIHYYRIIKRDWIIKTINDDINYAMDFIANGRSEFGIGDGQGRLASLRYAAQDFINPGKRSLRLKDHNGGTDLAYYYIIDNKLKVKITYYESGSLKSKSKLYTIIPREENAPLLYTEPLDFETSPVDVGKNSNTVSSVRVRIKLIRKIDDDKILPYYEKESTQIFPVNVGAGTITR